VPARCAQLVGPYVSK